MDNDPNPPAPVTALAFSPAGTALLSAGYRSISVRSLNGGAARLLDCELSQLQDLAFSPDGRLLAASGGTPGASGGVQWFAWPSGRALFTLRDRVDLVTAVAFSPDGRRLAAAG